MGREVWGTYSVRDHLWPQPWAADVLLYDRLVIPVPPSSDQLEGRAEWARWEQEHWRPERQRELLDILGDRAVAVEWSGHLRQLWATAWQESLAKLADQVAEEARRPSLAQPYQLTAQVLGGGLPARVTAVNAVATFRSRKELDDAVSLHQVQRNEPLPPGQAVVVLGREFLVPDPGRFGSDDDLLRAAVELSGDADVGRRRAAYWRWQREFLRDGIFTTEDDVQAAVEEMQDLIADEQRAMRRSKVRLVTMFAITAVSAALGVLSGPLAPLAAAGAFLSVGQFVAGQVFDRADPREPGPPSLLISAYRELGWQ